MMRVCVLLALQSLAVAASDEGLSLSDWGLPFKPPARCEVRWEASTNHLPKSVWVYKVVPAEFSSAMISNVMALGGYLPNNRTNIEGRPFSKHIFHFRATDGVGYLTYAPRYGVIDYLNETARAKITDHPEGVPSDSEATALALKFLTKLDVHRSQFSTQVGSADLQMYKGIRERGRLGKKEAISRDVYFIRRVDGIDFAGIGNYGGLHLAFGDRGKIAELQLLWPNLQRHKEYQTATSIHITERLRQGYAVIASGPNAYAVSRSTDQIKVLTVRKITPYYMGTSIMEEPKEFVHPFAELEVVVTVGDTNFAAVLNCPILGEEE